MQTHLRSLQGLFPRLTRCKARRRREFVSAARCVLGSHSLPEMGSPGQIVGQHIDRDRQQHHEKANPKQPRMMQTPPIGPDTLSLGATMMAGMLVPGHFCSL